MEIDRLTFIAIAKNNLTVSLKPVELSWGINTEISFNPASVLSKFYSNNFNGLSRDFFFRTLWRRKIFEFTNVRLTLILLQFYALVLKVTIQTSFLLFDRVIVDFFFRLKEEIWSTMLLTRRSFIFKFFHKLFFIRRICKEKKRKCHQTLHTIWWRNYTEQQSSHPLSCTTFPQRLFLPI